MQLKDYYALWEKIEPARRQMELMPIIKDISLIHLEGILDAACENMQYINKGLSFERETLHHNVFSISKEIEKIYKFVPSNEREQTIKDQCMQRALYALDNPPSYTSENYRYLNPTFWLDSKLLPMEHANALGALCTFGM